MIETSLKLNEIEEIESKTRKFYELYDINDDFVKKYREIFDFLDITKTEKLGRVELKFGMRIAGRPHQEAESDKLFKKVDTDGSQYIEFDEFILFMIKLHFEKYSLKNQNRKSLISSRNLLLDPPIVDQPVSNSDQANKSNEIQAAAVSASYSTKLFGKTQVFPLQ